MPRQRQQRRHKQQHHRPQPPAQQQLGPRELGRRRVRLDAEQGGNLLMTHTLKHRQAEHAAVALGQGIDQAQNLVVGDGHRHGIHHFQGALQGIERHHRLLPMTLQPGLRQVMDYPRHPGLCLRRVLQVANLAENQEERIVQQVIDGGLVGHVVPTDPAQPVVHLGVEHLEGLLVALLAPLDYLLNAQFPHRGLFDDGLPSTYYI